MLLVLLLGGQRLETSGIAVLDSLFPHWGSQQRGAPKPDWRCGMVVFAVAVLLVNHYFSRRERHFSKKRTGVPEPARDHRSLDPLELHRQFPGARVRRGRQRSARPLAATRLN
jgi:hypothetical protein